MSHSNNGYQYLGSYLVSVGIITADQMERALDVQREKRKKGMKSLLGHTLIELGYCTEEDITKALASRAGVPYISLESTRINPRAATLISPDAAKRYSSMAIDFKNDKLLVAMMKPNDIIAIDDLRILTGYDIQPVMVLDNDLRAAIDSYVTSDGETFNNREGQLSQELKVAMDQYSADGKEIEQMDEEDIAENIDYSDSSSEKPAVQLANLIFNQAVQTGASDVHVEPKETGMRVRFRIDGVLHEIMQPPRKLHATLVSRIKVMANMDIAERRIPQDGRITLKVDGKTIDVRVASMPTAYGEKLTMRLLDRSTKLLSLKDMGFPEKQLNSFNRLLAMPYGFILVTGPTGSGKSTTLYAALTKLNSVDRHIITLEDPIERRIDGINQVQVNVRAGMTFASGLRSMLRNDPDIIMVGEIRDQETARIAVESALTGHLVLATLHTNDSAGAITRIADMGIEPYLTASSLAGVVAQRLVRLLCPSCKEKYTITRRELLLSVPDFPINNDDEQAELYKPKGCIRCSNTGYKGRRGVYEVLLNSDRISRMILNRQSTKEIMEAAILEGMVTMRQDGLNKVKEGMTSLEEVMRVIV